MLTGEALPRVKTRRSGRAAVMAASRSRTGRSCGLLPALGLALLFFFGLGAAPAWTQDAGAEPAFTLKTPSDPTALLMEFEEGLEGAARKVKSLYPALLKDTEAKLGFSYPRTLRVQLFRSHESFSRAVVAAGGRPKPPHIAAVAFGHKDLIILKSRAWTSNQNESLETIFQHELAHCFIGHLERLRPMSRIPLWLNEGVAQWVSEAIFWGKAEVLDRARASGSVIPLAELERNFPDEEGASQLAYAQSLALVRHIAEQRRDRRNVADLLDLTSRGVDMDTALRAVIGVDRKGLEEDWLRGQRRFFGLSVGQLMEFSFGIFILVATLLLIAVNRSRRRRKLEALDDIDDATADQLPWREGAQD